MREFKVGDTVVVVRTDIGSLGNLTKGTVFKITSINPSIHGHIGKWVYKDGQIERGISINALQLAKSQLVKEILDNL